MDAETLAALERAVAVQAERGHDEPLIRALIKRERAGGERAKVVAYAQAQRQKHFDRAHRPSPQTTDGKPSRMGDDMRLVSRAKAAAYDELLATIASGAHEERP